MNNAKACNAFVAMTDAMANLAQDYEGQIAQLKLVNDALARQLKSLQEHSLATDSVVGRVDAILSETIRKPEGRNDRSLESFALKPEQACRYLQEELRRAPCLMMKPSDGSPGLPPTDPMFKASTPSASSTG